MARTSYFLLLLSMLVWGSGCAHGHKPFLVKEPAPANAEVAQILQDLAAQAVAIQNFDAKGVKVLVRGPGLEAEQLLPQSRVFYRRPAELHVIGRKFGGKTYARITVSQDTFLLELPVENQFFLRGPGQSFSRDAPHARPGDVVRELFAPEEWAALDPGTVQVMETDKADSLFLIIPEQAGTRSGLRRELEVTQVAGRWVLVRSVLGPRGAPIAGSTYDNYQKLGGTLFPFEAGIQFPGENAAIRFYFGNVNLNASLDSAVFNVQAQLQLLERRGDEELQPYRSE